MYQLEGNLEDALKHWVSYQNALQKLTDLLTETEYTLHRYSAATGDIQGFGDQIKHLKVRILQRNQATNVAFRSLDAVLRALKTTLRLVLSFIRLQKTD